MTDDHFGRVAVRPSSLSPPAHERYLRSVDRLRSEYAAGEGSRTVTLTLAQRAYLAGVLEGLPGREAESLRMVLDLDESGLTGSEEPEELVSAGQEGFHTSRC